MNHSTEKPQSTSEPTTKEIVAHFLPDVDWTKSPEYGTCRCPGEHMHSHRSTANDCRVYISGIVPTVYCVHQSCQSALAEANRKIREVWRLYQPEPDPAVLAAARQKAAARAEIEARAIAGKDKILKEFSWDFAGQPEIPNQTVCFLFKLFKPDDIVWVGEPDQSGSEFWRDRFRPVYKHVEAMEKYWVADLNAEKHFTCASTFKPSSFSRGQAAVITTPYLIVEGDEVIGRAPETVLEKAENRDGCAAIFKWLRDGCGMKLRAVVDSGNKSLHGWFEMPSAERLEELKIVLPALGCDRAMFKPTQPARLPGVMRENGNLQRLLYLE